MSEDDPDAEAIAAIQVPMLRHVVDAVRAVERAWVAEQSAEILLEPWVEQAIGEQAIAGYRRVIERCPRPPAWRMGLVQQVFDELRVRKKRPTTFFKVERRELQVQPSGDSAGGDRSESLQAAASVMPWPREVELSEPLPGARAELRLDQALAARHWGVWYTSSDSTLEDALETAWEQGLGRWLVRSIAFLNRLPIDFAAERIVMFPDQAGAAFERLVLDILNEERLVARHAPLDEDLFEKTDLRVRIPGLERKSGARVQVTLVTDPERLGEKMMRVKNRDEFVVVSPMTLAIGAWGLSGTDTFPRPMAAEFFEALRANPTTPDELALALRSCFVQAMVDPATPFGAMLRVPAPIRRFLRIYVIARSRETTSQLRARQGGGGHAGLPVTPTVRRGQRRTPK